MAVPHLNLTRKEICSTWICLIWILSGDFSLSLHEPGNVDLGVNQVVSELSSTVTEILLSEKDMNTQGNAFQ
ncbi:hypothetical protein C3L33_08943, partial [Rhododendron williamsianum]